MNLHPVSKGKSIIGRRGACLLTMGYIEVIYGLSMVAIPEVRARPGIDIVTTFVPGVLLGFFWVVAGCIALIAAFFPTGIDRHGFRAAYIMPVVWGTNYLLTTLLGRSPDGWVAGLSATFIWYGYAAMVLAVSGMIAVEDIRKDGSPL